MRAIDKAVSAAGGQAALASKLGKTRAFVHQMVVGRRPVPIEQRARIERVTGVRCEEFGGEVEWVRDRKGRVTHYITRLTEWKAAA